MLRTKDFSVMLEGKKIVDNISFEIGKGEVAVIMGPNGSGKSTLCKGMMGHPLYETEGEVVLNGERLDELPANERAKKGLFLTFQEPPEIEGVSLLKLMSRLKKEKKGLLKIKRELDKYAEELGAGDDLTTRNINVKFSGGEKKRLELIQIKALEPKAVLFDELDSGIDVDGMKSIKSTVEEICERGGCCLMITHQTRLFRYVKPDKVMIMINGRIAYEGDPEISEKIDAEGYRWIGNL